MVAPVLLYGCENWALNRADKRRIEMVEMKFLREVAGHTFQDEISTLTIQNEQQIFNIGEITDQKITDISMLHESHAKQPDKL
jgi:hypothetical protein